MAHLRKITLAACAFISAWGLIAQTYTLADFKIEGLDPAVGELALNCSEHKLDYNHPLP